MSSLFLWHKPYMTVHIISTGAALPQECLDNQAFIERHQLDSTAEWITSRTGITQRHICGAAETTATLAATAAEQALAQAGWQAAEVDVILVATCTPDYTFPSVALQVQAAIGARTDIWAQDIQAACSGFIHALGTAHALLEQTKASKALVIGADTFSHILDYTDRTTCVLFGDGAGAVTLERKDQPGGIQIVQTGGDGQQLPHLCSSGGVGLTQTAGVVTMNGREVFKQAVRQMSDGAAAFLAKQEVALTDIDWIVPHQANARIIEACAKGLDVSMEKVVLTVAQHANTSAASIPLALAVAHREKRFKPGDQLYLQAFGAGFVWGHALLRWSAA